MTMELLLPQAAKVGALLKERKETIAIAESSTGGLLAASLLAVPGASAYFKGGAVLYTRKALLQLMNVDEARLKDQVPSSEAYTLLKAQLVRDHLEATWGLSESGVAGPTGNKYGYAPGHSCIAVSGPTELTKTIETGERDRVQNMYAFAAAALELLSEALRK
ncbi:MAG TPA: CinA family protein [Burkholderiales bacterium]|nr:CinA family protein [Burkholderiales bacterium]